MNKSKNWVDCQERFRRVIAYIQDHMYDELDMNRLAEVACLSPCHWHRIYHAICRCANKPQNSAHWIDWMGRQLLKPLHTPVE